MPVTTLSAAVNITPTVFKTFFEHTKRKGRNFKEEGHLEEAKDDIFFDEAFHIVKQFIILGTKNTVESLQEFTNTHVPAPWWAAVCPVQIPLSACNSAADLLIEWFGPEDIKSVVGGERWWQVRGLDGIDAEWITEKEYLSDAEAISDKGLSDAEETLLKMEHLEPVVFYVHGGGYFWGSINTHRYQIIRYARKCKGRAFTVNYRKAPQYPWPCPLQDIIAAYLYLIQPPPGALHKPISPSKIVFAGDSAGGGLSLTAITILRDMGLPLPAGAVLISPWVDLTHSFPSIMENAATDIIPPHGFLAKPSTLWPMELLPQPGTDRVMPTITSPPPRPGHSDTLRPNRERREEDRELSPNVQSQEKMLSSCESGTASDENGLRRPEQRYNESTTAPSQSENSHSQDDIDFWEPKPPKVLMENPKDIPLELRSQIQMYATTEQLTHPLVSPTLQGSLGNLCPLYILAGDKEVLRDEIIYLAHRAAHPNEFPARDGLLRDGRRQKENADKFRTPTKVHLQVFDDMCHVLTVFSFTESAKYAYRSIAEFVKHVTSHSSDHLERNPFPELHRPPSSLSDSVDSEDHRRSRLKSRNRKSSSRPLKSIRASVTDDSDVRIYRENEEAVVREVQSDKAEKVPDSTGINKNSLSLSQGKEDVRDILMIRERVNIHGLARPMEPKHEVLALLLRPAEIGIIKEAPCRRWAAGQNEWDKRFKRHAERAKRQRQKNEAKAERIISNAREQGLVHIDDELGPVFRIVRRATIVTTASVKATNGTIQDDRRWGPLDLASERPPPSAIAGRRDTPEALALLKKTIYHTAPVTHKTIPRMKTMDAIRAAFDPHDDPIRPPKQSVSEQQVRTHVLPVHGVRVWDALLSYFMRTSSRKAANGTRQAAAAVQRTGERMGGRL